ncbi:MAG: hypothetical protein QM763_02685 [Agriterribacter sp.]
MRTRYMAAVTTFFLLVSCFSYAQDDSPVTSLNEINTAVAKISQKYLAYMSAVAHNNNKAKKAEKKRDELLEQIIDSRADVMGVPGYKGDKSLKEATLEYLKITSDVMNEKYEKVVNMEAIAEQSYDNMEAYLLMQKAISDKIEEANEFRRKKTEEYCKKYNITLVDSKDELSDKLKTLNEVHDYENTVYLIFFKCSAQEDQLMEALKKKNITAIEQTKNAMSGYADEGLAKLDTLKAYKSDPLLKNSCRSALEFFKKEAEKFSVLTDFFMKEEAFNQVRKNFENNPSAKNDKAEIDKYNKAVNEINVSSKQYNQTNQSLNETRKRVYDNWNNAVTTYLDRNVPYAK